VIDLYLKEASANLNLKSLVKNKREVINRSNERSVESGDYNPMGETKFEGEGNESNSEEKMSAEFTPATES